MGTPQSNKLPPGFRFHPTDEELILHYLRKKVTSIPLPANSIIADINIYKFAPWELPAKAAFGEKEWYFFSPRDRKYPNGARPNRVAVSGYWKATGTDKNIVASSSSRGGVKVKEEVFGVKKALVFYKGKPPKGIKTNWIMHEYRLVDHNKPIKLEDISMRLDDWVLCRIYKKSKNTLLSNSTTEEAASVQDNKLDQEEEQLFKDTILPIFSNDHKNPMIPDPQSTLISQKSLSFSNLLDATDFSMLSSFLNENHSNNNPTPPLLLPSEGFSYGNLDQESEETPQNNITTTTSNSYLFHKYPSSPYMENMIRCKRQISNMDEDMPYYPSKKYKSSPSCNFPNNTNFQDQNPQWNHFLLKQSLMNNQQLLLGGPPHLQFHG